MSTEQPAVTSIEDPLPQPGLRERKKRQRQQRIIAVSRSLFLRKGFQETTIQDIALESGIGLGTLYLYAHSKEDLLVLVFRETLLELLETAFDRIPVEAPFIDQVMAFFDTHIQYHQEDSVLARTVLKELSFPVTEQRRQDISIIIQATYGKLIELVRRGQAQGLLPADLFLGTTVSSIFGLYYHLLQGLLCGFLTEDEFRRNLRNALRLALPSALSLADS